MKTDIQRSGITELMASIVIVSSESKKENKF
jgi:hypothetical protein